MADLFERTWPVAGAKAAVVIVHGLGEHSGRYEYVARALNAKGYSVFAQDVRGHGQSIGFPGDMGDDIDRLFADVVDECVRVRAAYDIVFLLAHSMGTLISMPAVTRMPSGTLRGLILSGTALRPGPAAAEMITNGAVPPSVLSRDPAVVKAYEDDPLVWKKVPIEVLIRGAEIGELAEKSVPEIQMAVLLIHGTDDQLCSIDGANYVWVQLVTVDKVLQGYPGLYHEVLNEPERDQVIGDVVAWLDKHVAAP
jgi:alpha-beta hydrolase superfamily lysophospholipase